MAASSTNGNGGGNSGTVGIAILVAAATVYDITAAVNSSPQTTEINAKARAKTLMKWVNIGTVQAVGFVLIAAAADRRNRAAIFWSGMLAAGLLYGQYVYAKACGLKSAEPGTETYGAATGQATNQNRPSTTPHGGRWDRNSTPHRPR
jgi:hypothetical protein